VRSSGFARCRPFGPDASNPAVPIRSKWRNSAEKSAPPDLGRRDADFR